MGMSDWQIKEGPVQRWSVARSAAIDEITEKDGAMKWRVEVWDADRPPFLRRFFSDPEQARSFLDRVRAPQ